jgi:hypothetical protein
MHAIFQRVDAMISKPGCTSPHGDVPISFALSFASILPKDFDVRSNPLEEVSDDEVADAIVVLRSMIPA